MLVHGKTKHIRVCLHIKEFNVDDFERGEIEAAVAGGPSFLRQSPVEVLYVFIGKGHMPLGFGPSVGAVSEIPVGGGVGNRKSSLLRSKDLPGYLINLWVRIVGPTF